MQLEHNILPQYRAAKPFSNESGGKRQSVSDRQSKRLLAGVQEKTAYYSLGKPNKKQKKYNATPGIFVLDFCSFHLLVRLKLFATTL